MSKVISFSISDRYLDKLRSLYPSLTDNLAVKQFVTDRLDGSLGNSLDASLDDGLDDRVKTLIESWVDGSLDERLDAAVGKLITSLSERMARIETRLDDSLDGSLDDMELLLRMQREASIASPLPTNQETVETAMDSVEAISEPEKKIIPLPDTLPVPTGETSPSLPPPARPAIKTVTPDSPPSPPDQPAIEEIKKKITLPDTSIVYPIGIVETVEPDPSIDTELEAIEPLTSEPIPIDDTVASAIETVTVEVVNEANSSIESVTDAIKTVLGEPDSTIDTEPGAIETDSKPWYTVKELLDCHYPGWPTTSDKLRKKAETEQWPKRTRRGSKGNPYEYQAVLPSQGKG